MAFGHQVQLGYLAQLRDAAIPGATVLDALLEAIPLTPGEARGYLARFLFRGDDVFKEVRPLSGGERSRLELALLGIMPSNLLLLDEPTNHLDIAAREAIEAFLAESPATLLVVSHDRRLLETICEKLWVVDDAMAVPFDGGYRAWRPAVADGWTVEAEAKRRANRLRTGAPAVPRDAGAGSGAGASSTPVSAPAGRAPEGPQQGSLPGIDGRASAPGTPSAPQPQRVARSCPRTRIVGGARLLDAELSRLGLRKSQLELAMGTPAVAANFVEMRRVTSELADVDARAGRGRGRLAGARGAGAVTLDRGPSASASPVRSAAASRRSRAGSAELGVQVIDADQVARDVTAPGTGSHAAILRRFGPAVAGPDGTLDRAALGRLVFSDPAALRDLEGIVHPAVRPRDPAGDRGRGGVPAHPPSRSRRSSWSRAGWRPLCDEVWLVTCEPRRRSVSGSSRVARPRMSRHSGWRHRPASRSGSRPAATWVLDTAGIAADTRAQVVAALGEALAGR